MGLFLLPFKHDSKMLWLFCSDKLGRPGGEDRKERRTEVCFLPLIKMDTECLVSSVPLWR